MTMRNFIIGLSILCYALSGIITFKALGFPDRTTLYENNLKELKSKDISPALNAILGQFANEQAANRALVEKLQATIARLDHKLSNKNEEIQSNVETEGYEKKPRVLAVLSGGAFRPGQAGVGKNLMIVVKKLVPDILASPDYRVIVEGHTDSMPVKLFLKRRFKDNMELSFFRAKAIARILVKYGISSERIAVIGYGDIRPIASNKTDEGRVKNRRVEIKLVPDNREF